MRGGVLVLIPIGLLILLAVIGALPAMQASVAQVNPPSLQFQDGVAVAAGGAGVIDVYASHAWDKHDTEGIAALKCLSDNGRPSLTYRERNSGPVHFLCLGDDGKWYDVIVQMIDEARMELKSAFSPKGGNSSAIRIWLQNKGATVWKGGPSTIEFNWHIAKPW